jgi:cysteinyl-tRNA synthetase
MHNEMLQVEGKKMSKSLGNFFTVRDLLDQGWPGEVIRFVYLGTHYSKPMDWTSKKANDARMTLKAWFAATDGIEPAATVSTEVVEMLSNDLNTAGAIAILHELKHRDQLGELKAAMQFLGFPSSEKVEWFRSGPQMASFVNLPDLDNKLFSLVRRWQDLRNSRQYAQADLLKSQMEACGLKLSVTVAGPEVERMEGFDPAALEALL